MEAVTDALEEVVREYRAFKYLSHKPVEVAHKIICRFQRLVDARNVNDILPKLEAIVEHIRDSTRFLRQVRVSLHKYE